MEPFTTLTAVAAPYDHPDVDTDELIPHRYLRKPLAAGYGNFLFHDLRHLPDGSENPQFVLNKAPFRTAQILVCGRNFGCGSTREGAVYALRDFGIRALIAPSFAEIFAANCIQNGVLPVTLPEAAVSALCARLEARPGAEISVDLPRQMVSMPGMDDFRFEIVPTIKRQLLEGLDEIGLTLEHREAITRFEQQYRATLPWLTGIQSH